jgi:hypothetical protein
VIPGHGIKGTVDGVVGEEDEQKQTIKIRLLQYFGDIGEVPRKQLHIIGQVEEHINHRDHEQHFVVVSCLGRDIATCGWNSL